MSAITPDAILQALEAVKDPDMGTSIVSMGMIKDIVIDGSVLAFTCELTTPACPVKEKIESDIRERIAAVFPAVTELKVNMTGRVRGTPVVSNEKAEQLVPQIKNIILVGAGKGGVGKSTCTINLAVALRRLGARVAVLDCDIYGPSLPMMVGIKDKPKLANENKIRPIEAYGMEVMSMGFLVDPNQALVFRGPVLNGIVVQFLKDVTWGEADYLIVDLPPGTGDVVLSLTQACNVNGAVLVSTPQHVALADVKRAKAMFDQVKVPVLGLIENMSGYTDPETGKTIEIFKSGGGELWTMETCIPYLGKIPLTPDICESGDAGAPIVHSQPNHPASKAFIAAAEKLAAQISIRNLAGEAARPLSEPVA